MGALDVAFANRYLDALRADTTLPGSTAAPWNVLLERRGDQKLEKLQFAAAGVNAHIDYDLAPAVVTTWEILGTGDPSSVDQRSTYRQISAIFASETEKPRKKFETAWEQSAAKRIMQNPPFRLASSRFSKAGDTRGQIIDNDFSGR
jgi:uncharacterized protein DUF5995